MKFILIFSTLVLFSFQAYSAQVLKTKGSAVLIDALGDNLEVGGLYYLVQNGNKKGILRIIKLKPGKALGRLLKGTAQPTWSLVKRSSKKRRATVKAPAPAPEPSYTRSSVSKKRSSSHSSKKLSLGFALGYSQNSSEVNFTNPSGTSSLSGSSMSYEVIADYMLYKNFGAKFSLGMQNFLAEDSSNRRCVGSAGTLTEPCTVDLSYINLDIWLKYYFTQGSLNLWGGAGLGVLFAPKYNSTTAVKEEDLATTTLIQVGGGLDYRLSNKISIPFWLEYGLYPSSDTVTMNSISGYLGLSYHL